MPVSGPSGKVLLIDFWPTTVSTVAEMQIRAYFRLPLLLLCLLCFLVVGMLLGGVVLALRSYHLQAMQLLKVG